MPPSADRRNVPRRIASYNAGRDPERLALKYAAMRRDPFAFLRGTAHLFYEDWAGGPRDALVDEAPRAWICGDLHLENFGTFKGENGLVYFDINDFDEAALAPASWDLVRFLISLRVACRQLGLAPAALNHLAYEYLSTYAAALRAGKPYWLERGTTRGAIRRLLKQVKSRKRGDLVAARTVDRAGRKLIIDGRHSLSVPRAERTRVAEAIEAFGATTGRPGFFRALDVARRIAGTGSLGVARYVVLVRGSRLAGPRLLDFKEAKPSVVAAAARRMGLPTRRWPSEAHRVATTQHVVQAVTPAFLVPVQWDGRSFTLKSLQPTADRLSLEAIALRPKRLSHAIGAMARLTAWAHLRSASRWGAAPVDAWMAWAQGREWPRAVADCARRGASALPEMWKSFCRAYDRGEFS